MLAVLATVAVLFVALKLQYLFVDGIPDFRKRRKPLNWIQRLVFHGVGSFALSWNDIAVHNAEAIDKVLDGGRSCLMLGYHSRCTTDILLVMSLLQPRLIVTHLFFAIPVLRTVLAMIGFLPSKTAKSGASEEQAFVEHLSQTDSPLMLLPGGIFEALKPIRDRFKVNWKDAPGYARVIERHIGQWKTKGLSVVPFYTRNSEHFYPTTVWWHEFSASCFFRLYDMSKEGNLLVTPLMITTLLFSLGCVICPMPVQLDTVCGDPVHWEAGDTAESFNRRVVAALQKLVDDSNAKQFTSNRPSNTCRDPLLRVLFGAAIVLQNVLFASVTLLLIWSTFLPLLVLTLFRTAFPRKKTSKAAAPAAPNQVPVNRTQPSSDEALSKDKVQ